MPPSSLRGKQANTFRSEEILFYKAFYEIHSFPCDHKVTRAVKNQKGHKCTIKVW